MGSQKAFAATSTNDRSWQILMKKALFLALVD